MKLRQLKWPFLEVRAESQMCNVEAHVNQQSVLLECLQQCLGILFYQAKDNDLGMFSFSLSIT